VATLPAGISSFFGRFLGNAVSAAAGVAIGEALAPVLETGLQSFKNSQWTDHPDMPPPASDMADGVARGIIDPTKAGNYALQSGYGTDQFALMTAVAQKYPELGALLQLQRRSVLSGGTFETAGAQFTALAEKLGFEDPVIELLVGLLPAYLAPAEIANAIQQGHITDEGILPPIAGVATPAGGVGTVTSPDGQGAETIDPTVIALSGIAEAEKAGIDEDRLKVLANLVGLSPGQHELLQMWNRGIIDEASVDIGIREGHQKTKWTTPFKRLRWSVLSELQYVEARVRGWITNQELYDGGALTGYTKDQLDLLHSTHGRPPSAAIVARGLARGGVRLDPTADFTGANPIAADGSKVDPIPDALFKAMQQSNLQQQWYDIERLAIVAVPSLFMLNRLALADPSYIPRAVTNLEHLIYDPIDITAIEAYWNANTAATGAAAKADPFVTKADNQLWTFLHTAYVKNGVDRATVESAMTVLVDDAADREIIFERWDTERTLGSAPTGP
jgi:hypothetical protein